MSVVLQIHVKLSKTIYSNDNYQVVVFNAISKNIDKRTFVGVGNFPKLLKNEELLIEGHFKKNKAGKEQFQVESWKRPVPSNKKQIISFFSSNVFKGIGKKTATLIYEALGDGAITKINNNGLASLEKVEGLSKAKCAEIALITQEIYLLNDIIEQYQTFGIGSEIILKAHSKLANKVIELKDNPYLLAHHGYIHFYTADEIGQQMGILPHATNRLETVLYLFLKEMNRLQGHCFIEEHEVLRHCLGILNRHTSDERDCVHEMSFIAMMEESKHCYIKGDKVYPTNLYFAEKDVAEKIHHLTLGDDQYQSVKVDKAIRTFEKKHQTVLSSEQKQAIHRLTQENLLLLTGGPGTGKTFTTNAILQVYKSLFPQNSISLAAPTGRAAKRLGEVTGMGSHAQTIHRMLGIGYNGMERPLYNQENPLESQFIIIDEFSMVDIELARYLFNSIPKGAKVLIVGDPDQLPSVNAGNVLKDCLDAQLPQVRLTKIFRQAKDSAIITNAHKINKGEMISLENTNDYYYIESNNPKRSAHLIAHAVQKLLSQGKTLNDIMVLSPMKLGDAGVYELNAKIQELINPHDTGKKEVDYKNVTYRVGDKVMYLVNNRELDIFNGDIGIITNITKSNGGTMTIDFDGNLVSLEKEDWKDIQHSFALSIHKSQGGQAKCVIMCLSDEHNNMLTRNLFYTGQTRAEEMFVLIGMKTAIEKAIKINRVHDRKTNLKEKILDKRKYLHTFQYKKLS